MNIDSQAFPDVEANRTVATVPVQTVVESLAILPIEEVLEPAKSIVARINRSKNFKASTQNGKEIKKYMVG